MAIRNPVEWGVDQIRLAATAVGSAGHDARRTEEDLDVAPPVREIGMADLKDALAKGLEDFGENRTDVVFLCVMYPLVGLILARLAFGYDMLPLIFPLASGFALVGPFAAIGLYEISRQRELGVDTGWLGAFGVLRSHSFGPIVLLGLVLMALFVLWMVVAGGLYVITLGPAPPVSVGAFIHDVFTTAGGWVMIIVGIAVGFLFAVLVLAISVVSFPMLLDRDVGVERAVWTSMRAVAANPRTMATWGLIVAGLLVLGSIPFLLGLVIVMPTLGHATWHLYRKLVPN